MADAHRRHESRPSTLKCAIYTRKSSEEGLDQDFNSLDAQREACEAYIKSQRHEGWQALDAYYDDGGISGGTMERPALMRMLDDIETGKINIVVVYKVDRLTRSLADFAKIVEIFDKAGASFVSVTQQFNTTSSMGRLTLNVLLSFAQFEREVTGERIRDKIAASKKKGMWMGGNLPLGYDTHDRKLVINETEAKLVKHIYQRYIELGSVDALKDELTHQGAVSKIRVGRQGRVHGGTSFARGALYHLLQSRLYLGEIVHKDKHYPGNHEAIVPKALWEQAQKITQENRNASSTQSKAKAPSLLTGLLFDEAGERLIPSHANKSGIRYRYYVTKRSKEDGQSHVRNLRIPAGELEELIVQRLMGLLSNRDELTRAIETYITDAIAQEDLIDRASDFARHLKSANTTEIRAVIQALIGRVDIGKTDITMHVNQSRLPIIINNPTRPMDWPVASNEESFVLVIPVELKRRGLSLKLIIEGQTNESTNRPDAKVLKLIAKAFRYQQLLITSNGDSLNTVAIREGITASYFTRVLRISLLPTTTIESALNGTSDISLNQLLLSGDTACTQLSAK